MDFFASSFYSSGVLRSREMLGCRKRKLNPVAAAEALFFRPVGKLNRRGQPQKRAPNGLLLYLCNHVKETLKSCTLEGGIFYRH